jgi:hypothetical protein
MVIHLPSVPCRDKKTHKKAGIFTPNHFGEPTLDPTVKWIFMNYIGVMVVSPKLG